MNFFRKRKVEEIDLEIKETKTKDISNIEMYSEKQEVIEDEYDEEMDFETKKQMLFNIYEQLISKNNNLLNLYYISKIFSRIAYKDKEFNQKFMMIDKHINRIRKDFVVVQKKVKANKEIPNDEIENLYIKANDLLNFHQEIYNNLEDLRKKYFYHLKIATMNSCMNKTNQELETMYKDLSDFLDEYKNLKEAAEYIFYNSGQFIFSVINSLVMINKKYDFNYFLPSEVIITLEIKEWIDLYNKVKFVMKNTQKDLLTNDFLNHFKEFEIRYIILMMNLETSNDKKIANYNI